jgi:hypothetical protein
MTPNLKVYTPADGSCANLDPSEITPVSGQTYDICGNGESVTGKVCVGAETIVASILAEGLLHSFKIILVA